MKPRFKSAIIALLSAVAMITVLGACENNEQTNQKLSTVDEQITAINTSLSSLKTADAELDGYIDTLKTTVAALESNSDSLEARIKALEDDTSNADLKAGLEELKSNTSKQIETLSKSILALESEDKALGDKITALETLSASLASKTWTEATFATLEQYGTVQDSISKIKADIAAVNTTLKDLQADTNDKISEINTTLSTLATSDALAAEVNKITSAYTSAISTARDELAKAYTEAISKAISDSETSMKSWVNATLAENYYTVSEIDAKLSALELTNATLTSEIEAQKTALNDAKAELTDAYTAAIIKAISDHDGEITTKLENINTLIEDLKAEHATDIESLQGQINEKTSEIEDLQGQLNEKSTEINDLTDRLNDLQIQINCLKGEHEYDPEKTTYMWTEDATLTPPVECSYSRTCKHCTKTFKGTNTDITYKNYIFTADFTKIDACENQIHDISDRTGDDTQVSDIATAIKIMLSYGTNVKLTLPETADITYFNAINDTLASMSDIADGSVELTIDGVSALPEEAFKNNTKIKSITLGTTVTSLEANVFNGCNNLTAIRFSSPLTQCTSDAFTGFDTSKATLTLSKGQKVLELNEESNSYIESSDLIYTGSSFCNSEWNGNITVPIEVRVEKDGDDASNKIKAVIDKGATTILISGELSIRQDIAIPIRKAFETAEDHTIDLIITETTIVGSKNGVYIFRGIKSLKSVTLDEGIKEISQQGFAYCTFLESVTLPSSLTKISYSTFSDCSNIKEIHYAGTIESWNQIDKSRDWKSGIPNTARVICSDGEISINEA